MNKEENNRLKQVETELAYLRQILEEFIKTRPIEWHQHYYYDYNTIKPILDYYKDLEGGI